MSDGGQRVNESVADRWTAPVDGRSNVVYLPPVDGPEQRGSNVVLPPAAVAHDRAHSAALAV